MMMLSIELISNIKMDIYQPDKIDSQKKQDDISVVNEVTSIETKHHKGGNCEFNFNLTPLSNSKESNLIDNPRFKRNGLSSASKAKENYNELNSSNLNEHELHFRKLSSHAFIWLQVILNDFKC